MMGTSGSFNVSYPQRPRVRCYEEHERQKFSLKVGTIFGDSPIGLGRWLPVMWLIANANYGISSWAIHRALALPEDRMVRAATCAACHAGRI